MASDRAGHRREPRAARARGAGGTGEQGPPGGEEGRRLADGRRPPRCGSFPSRGFQARGSPRAWRGGQGRLASEAGGDGGARPRRPGRQSERGPAPRPPEALSLRLPPPATRWRRGQRGARPARLGGRRGEGRRGRNKKAAPARLGRPASPGRPAGGTGLLFLVVRAAGALHGESVPATPSRPAAPRLAPA